MADKDSYSVSGSLAGRGTRERNQKRDELIDQTVTGKGQASSAPDTTTDTPKKKPVYTPSETERSTRTYGAPMDEPLVNKPQHDRRER